ncbi:BQ5605_C015g07945 [Microbotryum silenes-dioicae]|uniref:BQ5605_C015g07945 protein n=1 Tax=Microbotryum silenes-dioicae TaxID=796604 RepID=A0A2X0NWH0_9BASI|nr:BQ5605_C015g07945 [Microbotryum silenes-dioicae]
MSPSQVIAAMRSIPYHSGPLQDQVPDNDASSDLTSLDSSSDNDSDHSDQQITTPWWWSAYDRRLTLRCRPGREVHSKIILHTPPTSPRQEPLEASTSRSLSSSAADFDRRRLRKRPVRTIEPPPTRRQSKRIKANLQIQRMHEVDKCSTWIDFPTVGSPSSPVQTCPPENDTQPSSGPRPALEFPSPPSPSLCFEQFFYSPSLVALDSPRRPPSESFGTNPELSSDPPIPSSLILICPPYDLDGSSDHIVDSETEREEEQAKHEALLQHHTIEGPADAGASNVVKEPIQIDPTPSSSDAPTQPAFPILHPYHDLANHGPNNNNAILNLTSNSTTSPNPPPPYTPSFAMPPTADTTAPNALGAILSPAPVPETDTRKTFSIDKSDWVQPEKDLKISDEGYPPIWCQSRQELCEALPYFRAYQGGHYDLGERCIGYLLDGYPAPGDRCEAKGKIIISHGGGCSEGDGNEFRLVRDQTRDNIRVRALINCHKTQTPVVLLAGKNYAHFPWLGMRDVRYCVLGYNKISAADLHRSSIVQVEAEPSKTTSGSAYFTRFKFLFEWVSSQGQPWFEQFIGPMNGECLAISSTAEQIDASGESGEKWCAACQRWTPDVFEQAVACLDERCEAFFKIPIHGLEWSETPRSFLSDLNYRSSLLQPRHTPPSQQAIHVPLPIYPPALQDLRTSLVDYSRSSWRGFWCRQCGRLSSRSQWFSLVCSNPSCKETIKLERRILSADELRSRKPRKAPSLSDPTLLSKIEPNEDWEGWVIILGDDTRILQLWAKVGSAREGLADELFEQYQSRDVGELLKRNMLTSHKVSGGFLTSQFSFNAGQSYNHVVAVESYPFSDQPNSSNANPSKTAPPCVTTARNHLHSAVRSLCPDSSVLQPDGFNEVLSVAYYQGGKMSYHDDGEHGVGPIVASLSLGADATMSFRRKTKGASNVTSVSKDVAEGSGRKAKAVVQLQLRHGDVMIMHGGGVQKNLDHMVEPVNLRFAATARFIHPSNGSTKTGRKKKTTPTSDALALATSSVITPPTPTSIPAIPIPTPNPTTPMQSFEYTLPTFPIDPASFPRTHRYNLPPLPPSCSPISSYNNRPSYVLSGEYHPRSFVLPPQATASSFDSQYGRGSTTPDWSPIPAPAGSNRTGRKKKTTPMSDGLTLATSSLIATPTPASIPATPRPIPTPTTPVISQSFEYSLPKFPVDPASFLRTHIYNLAPLPPGCSPISSYNNRPSNEYHPQSFALPPQATASSFESQHGRGGITPYWPPRRR